MTMTKEEAKKMEGTEFTYVFEDGDTMPAYVRKADVETGKAPPKDARVLVRDTKDAPWLPRYSAGRTDRDGWLLCYSNGGTSWTSKSAAPFKYWKLPEEDQQ